MNSYNSFIFDSAPDEQLIPQARLNNFHWEQPGFSRPETYVRFCAVRDKGFLALLCSREEPLLRRFFERDDPVYRDSCLEVFLAPVEGREEYINFEINPNGAFLAQFGKSRNDRTFISGLSGLSPEVDAFEQDGQGFWGVRLFIPQELISALYSVQFRVQPGVIRGNFYKCADDSPTPHYAALFPVGSMTPGFHNPSAFGRIIIDER